MAIGIGGHVMAGKSTWSDDHKALVRSLWPTHSASIIGDQLGCSRMAIIGLAHRMGLPKKNRNENVGELVPMHHRPQNAFRTKKVPEPWVPPIRTYPQNFTGVPLMQAKDYQCRAIIEGRTDADGLAMCCGKPVPEGQPYLFCAYHLSIFTTKGRYPCQSPT